MSSIKVLPEQLANQIAAGEVVERPASVVKELVENAIDANAQNISIQIEGDGSKLIRVVDDGQGMEEDDVLLCLERHATSKLHSSDQLAAINTLGFRGEAIPSIASVSRFSITSKPHDQELGCRADLKFGKLLKVHEMGCTSGTVMEVSNLFGNMPARKKFLKSKPTEIAHIDEVVKNYALVEPQIGFNYRVQGRMVLDLPPSSDDLSNRIKKIICRKQTDPLVEITSKDEGEGSISVRGFLLPPEISSATTGKLIYFVNGRMVKDKMLNHAVNEGLRGFLLKGRRPKGVIFLNLPPNSIDVNVHPTKQEVRFHKSNQIHGLLSRTVRAGIENYQQELRSELFGKPSVEKEIIVAEPKNVPYSQGEHLLEKKFFQQQEQDSQANSADDVFNHNLEVNEPQMKSALSFAPALQHPVDQGDVVPVEKRQDPKEEELYKSSGEKSNIVETKSVEISPEKHPGFDSSPYLRYVGQLFNTYILCETQDGLMAVDQHAAQERLIFEELRKQYEKNNVPGQILLVPEMVELDNADIQIVEQFSKEIARLGLDIQEFGGNSFIIKSVPATLSHLDPVEVLTGILSRFGENDGRGGGAARLENILAGIACKASIKAGRILLPEEVEALLSQMQAAGIFSHCPHGRPVVKSFSKDEVKKWFLRT